MSFFNPAIRNTTPAMNNLPHPQQRSVSPDDHFDWPSHLADYLEAHVDSILQAWGKAVDEDERIETVSALSRAEFEDSIPATLSLLMTRIRQGSEFSRDGSGDGNADADWADRKEATLAHEHGFHRWQEGYSMAELMMEWGHLHLCVVRTFNDYELQHPDLDREVMNQTRVALAQVMNAGFTQSVDEYHQLQQSEAREVVESLSSALKQVSELERQRGEMLREAVHDLRGSLSAAQAATHLLEFGAEADPKTQSSFLSVLQRSTGALHNMLTELLDLARLEAGQEKEDIKPIDSGAILRQLCEETEPLASAKGLYLRYEGPDNFGVESDPIKLRRIAQNLLLNAIKYTSQGGVTVRWASAQNDKWVFSIEDTGPGLTSSAASGETADVRAGEGVGLAIVKRLCTLLDAQMEIDSVLGRGTKISITWPQRYSAG
jgi:signal transduction histidine kinase